MLQTRPHQNCSELFHQQMLHLQQNFLAQLIIFDLQVHHSIVSLDSAHVERKLLAPTHSAVRIILITSYTAANKKCSIISLKALQELKKYSFQVILSLKRTRVNSPKNVNG